MYIKTTIEYEKRTLRKKLTETHIKMLLFEKELVDIK